tara:strand:- start:567 stop:740 length:174 start_codon:yes stop_codon:yes gene_type:complete
VNSFLHSFDEFVDDLISSEANLLKGELDFLIMQHLFESIDLESIETNDLQEDESLVA